MNLRQKRLADAIRTYASEDIMNFEQLHTHTFGIITVVEVDVNSDYDYADIYVNSQKDENLLPHFLAHCAEITRKRIGKDYSLRKIPILRFRVGKKQKQTAEILDIIHSLDRQYGLSRQTEKQDTSFPE